MTGSADLMEAHKGEEALPGSLSTGRAPALGLNAISAVGSSGLVDLIAQVAASWEDSEFHSRLHHSTLLWGTLQRFHVKTPFGSVLS